MKTDRQPVLHRASVQALLILAVCALVYWPLLGSGGLTATEGHRAIPGWEMLETREWVVPRMFGQAYMRKPPGMAWAVAASSAVFGQTEFAARAVSALCASVMALVAWGFAWAWFGRRGALVAGLAQALMPWMWTVGRQAEIEALMLMGAQVGALATVHGLRARTRGERSGAWIWALALAGWTVALMAKGPAALPAWAGAVVGAWIATRRWCVVVSAGAWVSVGVAAAIAGGWWVLAQRELASLGESAITQGAGAFMFDAGRALGIVILVPSALVAMMPASLALLFPWGPDARAEAESDEGARDMWVTARALAWACVVSAGVLVVAGISNVRYAMAALVFVAPAAGYVAAGCAHGWMTPVRRRIARAMVLGHPGVAAAVLIGGAWAWVMTGERVLREKSGREAGRELGELLGAEAPGVDGALMVRADHVIEARPEVLWHGVERARALGADVEGSWTPRMWEGAQIEPGHVVVARVDGGSGEGAEARRAVASGRARKLGEGGVAGYGYWVVRVEGAAGLTDGDGGPGEGEGDGSGSGPGGDPGSDLGSEKGGDSGGGRGGM